MCVCVSNHGDGEGEEEGDGCSGSEVITIISGASVFTVLVGSSGVWKCTRSRSSSISTEHFLQPYLTVLGNQL